MLESEYRTYSASDETCEWDSTATLQKINGWSELNGVDDIIAAI